MGAVELLSTEWDTGATLIMLCRAMWDLPPPWSEDATDGGTEVADGCMYTIRLCFLLDKQTPTTNKIMATNTTAKIAHSHMLLSSFFSLMTTTSGSVGMLLITE